MKRAHVAVAAATILSAASGTTYAILRYCVDPHDEFSAWNHPLQPWVLGAHVLLAPALVFALGWVFGEHVLVRLTQGPRGRRSGFIVFALATLLISSGTALPLCSDGLLRAVCGWTHGVAGALFLTGLLLHALLAWRASDTQPNEPAGGKARLTRARKRRLALRS